MTRTMLIVGASALLAACATTDQAEVVPEGETSIPYINTANSVDWKVASDDTLYIQGPDNDWYFVRVQGPCPRLRTALSLGFETSAGGQLDRFGAIRAEGTRCAIQSIVRSGPPPEGTGE